VAPATGWRTMGDERRSPSWIRMRQRMDSIRVRTTGAAVLVVGVALIAASAAMVILLERSLRANVRTTALVRAEAVAEDLADVSGPRIVVVVSDGKESCRGDPAAEARRLRAQGFDVTLNVVGLALDKPSREAIARLAEVGGGSYFDAGDAETLGAALRAAVSAPVEVVDASGTIVGHGTVGGDAIAVPPGSYRVAVLTDPVVTFEDVFVQPEADIVLTLPAPDRLAPGP